MSPALQPYTPEAVCPKCGTANVGTAYCPGRRESWQCQRGFPEGEHLHRVCRTCRYEWPERCLDEGEEK